MAQPAASDTSQTATLPIGGGKAGVGGFPTSHPEASGYFSAGW